MRSQARIRTWRYFHRQRDLRLRTALRLYITPATQLLFSKSVNDAATLNSERTEPVHVREYGDDADRTLRTAALRRALARRDDGRQSGRDVDLELPDGERRGVLASGVARVVDLQPGRCDNSRRQ